MDSNSELELGLDDQRNWSVVQEERDKKKVVELVDIISQLPNDIISRVLSFLETKEAIRTCVLSSRWRNLWKSITHIQLDGYSMDPEKFSNLVDHVLQNCSSTDFLVFDLDCPRSIELSRLNAWIGQLVSRKIVTLILHGNYSNHIELPEFPLPELVLSFTTLKFLSLNCFDIQIPESVVCFPCLKRLDLHLVLPDSVAVLNQLLSSCPVLEVMNLFGYVAFEVDTHDELKIDVSVTTLRRFEMELKLVEPLYGKNLDVIIDTPSLEYLSIEDDSYTNYVAKNLPWISNVYLFYEVVPENINLFVELLKGICATELLELQASTIDVLGSALSYAWPTFPNLTILNVQLSYVSGWTCFSKLLHCAPLLNVLYLDLEGINDVADRASRDDNVLYQWIQPNTVPKCLLEHLEMIGIENFEGNKDEVQVVEFLLNNAKVLESMTIGYKYDRRSEEVRQKLLMSPRASKSSKVEICNRIRFHTSRTETSIWGM